MARFGDDNWHRCAMIGCTVKILEEGGRFCSPECEKAYKGGPLVYTEDQKFVMQAHDAMDSSIIAFHYKNDLDEFNYAILRAVAASIRAEFVRYGLLQYTNTAWYKRYKLTAHKTDECVDVAETYYHENGVTPFLCRQIL